MWLIPPSIRSSYAQASGCSEKDLQPPFDTWACEAAASSTLSGKHSPPASWRRGWKKEAWMQRLYGSAISANSRPTSFEAWLTSLFRGFLVPTSALPESAQAWTPRDQDCSSMSSRLPTIAVRGSSLWRTSQASLLPPPPLWTKKKGHSKNVPLPESWENWPTAGGMRNGSLFQRPTWAPATAVNAGSASLGAWPTPTTEIDQGQRSEAGRHTPSLSVAVLDKHWQTPHGMGNTDSTGKLGGGGEFAKQATQWMTPSTSAPDKEYTRDQGVSGQERLALSGQAMQATALWATPRTITGGGESAERKKELGRENAGGGDLQAQVQNWPTPASRDYRSPNLETYEERGGGAKGEQLQNFVAHRFSLPPDQATPDGATSSSDGPTSPQRLNPIFGEWLMGWRLGWTNPAPHASSASATVLYRLTLQQHLSFFFDVQGS